MEVNLRTLESGKAKELKVGRDFCSFSKSELPGIPMVVSGMILGSILSEKFFKKLSSYVFTLRVLIFFLYSW